jgi:defect-in-organelle-trafficking protein DotC
MFKFAPMIAKNGTLPPVIVEARDVAAFSQDQVRTANRVYKIEREERFVSVPLLGVTTSMLACL